jgi:hypothetical protein
MVPVRVLFDGGYNLVLTLPGRIEFVEMPVSFNPGTL